MLRAIIGTLGYVVRDGRVLLVHRRRPATTTRASGTASAASWSQARTPSPA